MWCGHGPRRRSGVVIIPCAPANRDRKLTKPSLLSLLGRPGGRRAHRGGGGALIGGAAGGGALIGAAGGAPVEAGVVWP